MTTSLILFYVYAAIAVAGAIVLVTARRLLHAVLGLFATLVAIAALFMLMGSQFLAAMQLFVYGGAITILVLFGLMLTRPKAEVRSHSMEVIGLLSGLLCVVFFGALAMVLLQTKWRTIGITVTDTATIADILFSRYVLPFEIAGLSLTIALIGAIVIAREDDVRPDGVDASASPVASTPLPDEEGGLA
jgi:NADH-quinone oxidoreductase subunit J